MANNAVFYRDVQLVGTERDSPHEQLKRLQTYEKLVREKRFDEAEKLEREHHNGGHSIDLNLVISSLIGEAIKKKNFELAYMLVGRFEYRGYSTSQVKREEVLHSAKSIKGEKER